MMTAILTWRTHVRAASALLPTPGFPWTGVEMSLDTARTSACATTVPIGTCHGYFVTNAMPELVLCVATRGTLRHQRLESGVRKE